jgi:hypothetical protein
MKVIKKTALISYFALAGAIGYSANVQQENYLDQSSNKPSVQNKTWPGSDKSFEEYTKGKLSDGLWDATGGVLGGAFMDPLIGSLKSLLFNNTIGLLFGDKGPDQYMLALQDIQESLDRIEEKIDSLTGMGEITYNELLEFHNEYSDDMVNQYYAKASELPESIYNKSNSIFNKIGKKNIENIYMKNGNSYKIDDNKLFEYAQSVCANINTKGYCQNEIDSLVIKALDGTEGTESQTTFLKNNSNSSEFKISDLVDNYYDISKSGIDNGNIKLLNKKLVQGLGTDGFADNSDIRIPTNSSINDIIVPWFYVNNTLQKLSINYYSSLNSLYNIQKIQLAFYFSHPGMFRQAGIDRDFLVDSEGNPLPNDKASAASSYKLALNNLESYFRSKLVSNTSKLFGDSKDPSGLGAVYTNIPSLQEYILLVSNNKNMFKDKELNKYCSVASLTMPIKSSADEQRLLGRLTLQCYPNIEKDNTDLTTVYVGHDIPYTAKKDSGKMYIYANGTYSNIDGFHFDKDKMILSAGYYDKDGKFHGGINNDKSFYQWLPNMKGKEFDFDLVKHKDAANGNYLPLPVSNAVTSALHSWAQFSGYGIFYPDILRQVANSKVGFASSKGDNRYGRSSAAKYSIPTDNEHWGRITYCPNQANDWQGVYKSKESHPWLENQTMILPKNGHLFLITNQFPKTKMKGDVTYRWYAQFTRPVCFKNLNGQCNTINFQYGSKFDTMKHSYEYFKIGNSIQNPKTAVVFQDGTKIGIEAKLWGVGGDSGEDAKDLPVYNDWSSKASSVINLAVKVPYVYKFQVNAEQYRSWQQADNQAELNYAYLDGSLTFTRNDQDQKIISNKDYKLIFTISGALELRTSQGETIKRVPIGGSEITFNTLSLTDGDVIGRTNDNRAFNLIQLAYQKNNRYWVADRYARLELRDDGSLIVTSMAEDIDDSNKKLGDNGIIYSSKWGNNWPDFENQAPKEWVGESHSDKLTINNSNEITSGPLEGCSSHWW